MDRGIYTAASAGLVGSRRLQIIANNLANVSTVGFKAERLITRQQEFEDTLASKFSQSPVNARGDADRTPGVVDTGTFTDFTPGPVETTGNPLNVALRKHNHFFVIETANGQTYTRAGNFSLDAERNLVTADGQRVLGDGGAINLPPGKPIISSSGAVTVNGEFIGRIQVAEINDLGRMTRQEGARFKLEGAQATTVDADLVQEAVELPNVNVVEAMTEMMAAQRSFEAYAKTATTMDDLNDIAIRSARVL
jgi:flagellar basal-body rod protein FlgF